MSGLVPTVIIASILFLLAAAGLAIGLLLTGKARLVRGTCGRVPNARRDKHCGKEVKCMLCERDDSK
jgi:hypothetical protein